MRHIFRLSCLVLAALFLTKAPELLSERAPETLDIHAFCSVAIEDKPCLVNNAPMLPGVLLGTWIFQTLPGILRGDGSLAVLPISPDGQPSELHFFKIRELQQVHDLEVFCSDFPVGTSLVLLSCGPFAEGDTASPSAELSLLLGTLGAQQAPRNGQLTSWILITQKADAKVWNPLSEVQAQGACVELSCSLPLRAQ